jgi:hypothetical protein
MINTFTALELALLFAVSNESLKVSATPPTASPTISATVSSLHLSDKNKILIYNIRLFFRER